MKVLKVFTRKVEGNDYPKTMYPKSLANSIHFALKDENENDNFEVLNQNYGILFAAAKVNSDNTLFPRGLKNPKITLVRDEYFITAEYVDKNGNAVDKDFLCVYKTYDFVNFLEHQDFKKSELESLIEKEKIEFSDEILISEEIALEMKNRWLPLKAVNLELPNNLSFSEVSEIENVKAKVIYSDGSIDEKYVDLDKNSICKIENGSYEINGKIKPAKSRFPLTIGLADPVIYFRDGKWYYIATNDNVNDIGLYLRRSDSLEGLFLEGVETSIILDYDEKRKLCQTFWAPEFHEIGGELFILFAVSSEKWGPQCHMMKLKKGCDLMKAESWEDPVRVRRSDGSFLTEDAITLDMTYFRAGDKSYLAWSYREKIGTPLDSGSMICIATIDEEKPWVLT
ncbi:MAG: family 43 glycosylhydrolase, partial [Treponema sp.]|nr:family 43 glycosylhydrolase [Treponema sp.]